MMNACMPDGIGYGTMDLHLSFLLRILHHVEHIQKHS